MLGNVALFAPYKLSDILIPFIESRNLPGKSSFLSTLAQQVLLDWTLRQPSDRIDEVLAATILKVLEVIDNYARCKSKSLPRLDLSAV